MPTIPLHLSLSTPLQSPKNPLPQLLQTPSGLAILEIQGTINLPAPTQATASTLVGRVVFTHYNADDPIGSTEWQKTVHLYVGKHQRLTGEVKKLPKPLAIFRKRESQKIGEANIDGDELEIVEIVYYKVLFSSRPEPVGLWSALILKSNIIDHRTDSVGPVMGLDFGYPSTILESITWLLVVSASCVIVKLFLTAIYNVYFHPLRHFPGPWLAAATALPFVFRMLNGRMFEWTSYLHKRYGGVVRVLPDELSFVDASAWVDIYTSRPQLPKPEKGSIISPNGSRPIASITHTPDHTRQRRILSHAFSDRALREQEYILQNYSDLLVKRLRDVCQRNEEVDVCDWYNFATFDIISDLCFGESFNSLQGGKHHSWVATIFISVKIAQIITSCTYFPPMIKILGYFIPSSIRKKGKQHFAYSCNQIDKRIARKSDRPDIMKFILENNDEKDMTRDEINSTIQLVLLAGSETSATTITAVTWFSLKNPRVWERLKSEIRGAFTKYEDINVAAVSNLPFLRAVIQEALRLHPAGPVSIPRLVDRPDVVISGRPVPQGTRVGIPQKTAYRSPTNFVYPDSFVPERWLPDADLRYAKDDKAMYEPFMVGPRNCIGKTLAWAEMLLILCKVIYSFDTELSKNNVEDWSDQRIFLLHEKIALNVALLPTDLP